MMMTCVTPTAMMPISASCRIMILSLSGLAMKLCPTNIQPKTSNNSIIPIMTARMLSSGGRRRRPAFLASEVGAAVEISVATARSPFAFLIGATATRAP